MPLALAATGLLGVFFGILPAAMAADDLPGPIPATVMRVVDGDTVDVRARIWLGQTVETRVRLDGVDAPELRGDCLHEKEKARRARDRLATLADGRAVVLTAITRGKFAGRVLATVTRDDGLDFGARLVAEGLARAYDGGRRVDWCAEARLPGPPAPDDTP